MVLARKDMHLLKGHGTYEMAAAGREFVLLRLCAAAMLVRSNTTDTVIPIATRELAGVIVLAEAFCFGGFTPVQSSCLPFRISADDKPLIFDNRRGKRNLVLTSLRLRLTCPSPP